MRRLAIIILLLMFVCSCGGGRDIETETPEQKTLTPKTTQPPGEGPKDAPADIVAKATKPDYKEMPRPGVISGYDKTIRKYARRYLFDWRLISAQIYAESRFRYEAESYCGALGLMQIMPGTAKWLEEKAEKNTPELRGISQMLLDPKMNIHLGCYYDAMLFSRIKDAASGNDRQTMMLAAYNAGPGNLNKARRKSDTPDTWDGIRDYLPEETRNYIPTIYDRYEIYKRWTVLKPY